MNKNAPLELGIVGASRGNGHVSAIRTQSDRVILRGVYDPNAQAMSQFASEYGVDHKYDCFEAAVEECDILIIASPQQYHAPQAAWALDAGVHVLSEVPAAVSIEQVHQLLGAARRSNAKYMISENYCYFRDNLIVGDMARQGMFGDLYFGEAEYLHEMKHYQFDDDGRPTWRHHWQVGKNAVTYPTHSLGPLLQWMNDRIISVSCIGTGRWTKPDHEIEDGVTLSARTRKGGLIRMRLDLLSNRPELYNYYALQGTNGAFEAARTKGEISRVYLKGQTEWNTWQPLSDFAEKHLPHKYANPPEGTGHWGADAWPLLDLLDAIEADKNPPLDVYQALEMSLPGIVSEQSIAQNGAWLSVPDAHTLTSGIGINPGREAPLA